MIDDYEDTSANPYKWTRAEHEERWARICVHCNGTLGGHSADQLFCRSKTGVGFQRTHQFARKPEPMVISAGTEAKPWAI